jgi:lipid II isoglutaminyl synthase (glutamine-hydrolysing)
VSRLSRPGSLRLRIAAALGGAAGNLSRLLRRGDGLVIGGRVILAGCPDAFGQLTHRRRIVFVSSTNGKTTTTRLLAAAVARARPVVTNNSGANMPAGIVAALAHPSSPVGEADPAVLEADETYLPQLLAVRDGAEPSILLLGNLSRDQLDRVGEVAMVARRWRAVFARTPNLQAIANADDPHVVWAASVVPDVTWISVGQRWTADSALCPSCGAILRRAPADGGALVWSCGECGLTRPEPSWVLRPSTSSEPAFVVGPDGAEHVLRLALPGVANQANATLALVAAQALGVSPDVALVGLAGVASVGGRYQTVRLGGRPVRLLLGKNPAGWGEMFSMLAPAPAPVVIAINARAADGKDPSWLWDVPFEELADRFVVATGERRHDLAVRLEYAGVKHEAVADPWPPGAMPAAAGTGALDAVGTYTAFRELLRRGGGATDE